MTVTVNSLVSRAATVLQDTSNIRWAVTELIDWMNEGAVSIVKSRPDACTKTVNLTLVAGSKQSNPADAIEIIDMRQNNGGAAITPCDRTALDRFQPTWMTTPTASTVTHWMDDPQPDTFYVYPAQSNTPATVVMTYAAVPTTMAAGGNITIRDIYANCLLDYVLYRAYSKDSEYAANANLSAAHYAAFTSALGVTA